MDRRCKSVPERNILAVVLFCSFAFLTISAHTVIAQEAGIRSVTVSGSGFLYVLPDMATVRFGIITVDESPEGARAGNARAATELMNAIRDLGIDDRKIRLDVLRLEADRVYDDGLRRFVEKGFRAVREVTVRLEKLDRIPELISTVVEKGANRIHGISYGLADQRDVELEALKLALKDAKKRAEVMVETLGASLGDVLRVSEQGITVPLPVLQFERMDLAQKSQASTPAPDAFASGEIKVSARVTLVYTIE